MRATGGNPVRAGQPWSNADAIIADAERVQPVVLGGEIFIALLIRVPHKWFVHPPPMRLSGDVCQVRHCDRPQAGRLTGRPSVRKTDG